MRGGAWLCLLLALVCSRAWGHDPILVTEEVSVSADGTVVVAITLKQSVFELLIGRQRALFADAADLAQAEPALAKALLAGISLRADEDAAGADSEVALSYGGCVDAKGLPDPLTVRLLGHVGPAAKHLSLRSTLFAHLGTGYAVIDTAQGLSGVQGSAVLRPGEAAAFTLAPSDATGASAPRRPGGFLAFMRLGFFHIVPEGTDHILFVLGLFLLSPKLKPLLTQVTAFTIAHSLTLGLCIAGVLALPSRVTEPLIALSIVVVAVENIITGTVKPWRWMVVFCFGLVHGLGFAGALTDLHLPKGEILTPLVGFNCGVELGQLTVIAAAAALTWWCWHRAWYKAVVAIPASGLIALIGAAWAIQRALGFGIEA